MSDRAQAINGDLESALRSAQLAQPTLAQRAGHRVPTLRLEDCGEWVTRQQIADMIGRSIRYVHELAARDRRTGILTLPAEIAPGRYRREDVARFLKVGIARRVQPEVGARRRSSLRVVKKGVR